MTRWVLRVMWLALREQRSAGRHVEEAHPPPSRQSSVVAVRAVVPRRRRERTPAGSVDDA